MTPINLDMIKQLLQEFVDKESVTSAEIGVVQQQVQELEARISQCREKLKVINGDKEKISAMTQRYGAQAVSSSRTIDNSTSQESKTTTRPEKSKNSSVPVTESQSEQAQTRKDPLAPQSQSKPVGSRTTGDHPAVPSYLSLNFQAAKNTAEQEKTDGKEADNQAQKVKLNQDDSKTSDQIDEIKSAEPSEKTEEETDQEESGKKTDTLKESVDDTVKSINDALRGLFR